MLTLSQFYQSIFGCKTYKISLDAGCTCPNRDGTKGSGGCIFCSEAGSGDFIFGRSLTVTAQIEQGKKLVEAKLRGRSGERRGKYIAYFQSFTSTYGDAKLLLEKYREALQFEGVAGLAVATRPDCLSDEILRGLAEISQTHFVQIELGLQTSNETTGRLIKRCYTNEDYIEAVHRIREAAPEIHIVTHLVFGLPGETEEDMLNSVKFVLEQSHPAETKESHLAETKESHLAEMKDSHPELVSGSSFGLKITSLYVLQNTRLAVMYDAGEYEPLSKEQYFNLLKNALTLLPENCVVHRLTGDPPKKLLIAPAWPADKKRVLNELSKLF